MFNPSILPDCEAISFSVASDSVAHDRLDNEIRHFYPAGGVHNIRPDLTGNFIEISEKSLNPALHKKSGKNDLLTFIDWLRFNGNASEEKWRALVMLVFPGQDENFWVEKESHWKPHPGHRGFPHVLRGERGTRLAWRLDTDGDGKVTREWDLTLPGTPLEHLGTSGTVRVLLGLIQIFPVLNPTRIDFTVEDHSKSLSIPDIATALSERNYRGFLKKTIILSDTKGQGWDGFTANLGSRESDSYTRIYETSIKHGYPAIRVEREVKGELVKAYWQEIKNWICEERWTIKGFHPIKKPAFFGEFNQRIAQIAISGIDFIQRGKIYSNGETKNCPRLGWWDKFASKIGEWKIRVPRPQATLKRTHNWLNRQVKKTLAILKTGLFECDFLDLIDGLVNRAIPDLTDQDNMWIATLMDKGIQALYEDPTIDLDKIEEIAAIELPETALAAVPHQLTLSLN